MVDTEALRALVEEAAKADPNEFCREAGIESGALASLVLGVAASPGPTSGHALIAFIAGWRLGRAQ
jgi:hypothetical protein